MNRLRRLLDSIVCVVLIAWLRLLARYCDWRTGYSDDQVDELMARGMRELERRGWLDDIR